MSYPNNIVGPAVAGADFYGRDRELARLGEQAGRQNILLLAPRRVGKTSLLQRYGTVVRANNAHAVYIDVQGAKDEVGFIRRMVEGIREVPKNRLPSALLRRAIALADRLESFKVTAVEAKLRPTAAPGWQDLGRELEGLVGAMGPKGAKPWYLLVDELPVLVQRLVQLDPDGKTLPPETRDGQRAGDFLSWFRELRTAVTPSQGVHWVLCGSIGLDTLASRYGLTAQINDFAIERLGPFERDTAVDFLQRLGGHKALDAATANAICDRLQWLIPHHLQIMFHQVSARRLAHGPSASLVDDAFDAAVKERTYFESWYERLVHELGEPDNTHAKSILKACALDPVGASETTLGGVLNAALPDAARRDETLRHLLRGLESDGYLVEDADRFRFRSDLLRAFWVWRYAS